VVIEDLLEGLRQTSDVDQQIRVSRKPLSLSNTQDAAIREAQGRFRKATNRFAFFSALWPLQQSSKVETDVHSGSESKSSNALKAVGGLVVALAAKAMAAHRELGIPSALPYTSLRSVD
jgi:hypothetical protein